MMIGLHQHLIDRCTFDERGEDDLDGMIRRSMEKSECELCESRRYTDVEYGMDVCRPCQLEYLPARNDRSF